MGASLNAVLAVCDGGGDDTLAIVVVLLITLLYLLLLVTTLRAAEDWTERFILLALLVGSAWLGAFLAQDPYGIIGDGDYLGRFLISLPIAATIGFGVAQATPRVGAGRAILVALVGDILIPGGLIVLLFAAVGIGTGCLE